MDEQDHRAGCLIPGVLRTSVHVQQEVDRAHIMEPEKGHQLVRPSLSSVNSSGFKSGGLRATRQNWWSWGQEMAQGEGATAQILDTEKRTSLNLGRILISKCHGSSNTFVYIVGSGTHFSSTLNEMHVSSGTGTQNGVLVAPGRIQLLHLSMCSFFRWGCRQTMQRVNCHALGTPLTSAY